LKALNSSAFPEGFEQEHRRLLADLATEANAGFDNEAHSRRHAGRRTRGACHAAQSSTTPKCGTGTFFSIDFVEVQAAVGSPQDARRS
jgi:hypothetical protein